VQIYSSLAVEASLVACLRMKTILSERGLRGPLHHSRSLVLPACRIYDLGCIFPHQNGERNKAKRRFPRPKGAEK
jgi:hypothetical protein